MLCVHSPPWSLSSFRRLEAWFALFRTYGLDPLSSFFSPVCSDVSSEEKKNNDIGNMPLQRVVEEIQHRKDRRCPPTPAGTPSLWWSYTKRRQRNPWSTSAFHRRRKLVGEPDDSIHAIKPAASTTSRDGTDGIALRTEGDSKNGNEATRHTTFPSDFTTKTTRVVVNYMVDTTKILNGT